MKHCFLLFVFFCALSTCAAQQVKLKRPLNAQAKTNIANLAAMLYNPNPYTNLTVRPADLKPLEAVHPSKAIKSIKYLKEKLAVAPNDADINMQLGLAYAKANQRAIAKKYFQITEKLLLEKKERYPENSYYYVKLGEVYAALGSYFDASWYFEKAFQINPKDTLVKDLLPTAYISYGNYEKANIAIQKLLEQWPDDINLLLYSGLNNIYMQAAKYKPSDCAYYRSMAPENFADLSLLKKMAIKHNELLPYPLLMNMLSQIAISLKIPMENCSNYNAGEMNTADLLALSDIEDFYTRILQRKDLKNTYKLNLALGNLYLLRKEYARSRTYFENEIKSKSVGQGTDEENNIADAYDYMIASYLMQGDTTNAERYTQKKLDDKAELYPAARNYTELAAYNLKKNNLAAMDTNLRHALALDSACMEAYIGFGIYYIKKNDAARAEKFLNIMDKLQPGNNSTAILMAATLMLRDNNKTAYTMLKQAQKNDNKNPVIIGLLDYFDE